MIQQQAQILILLYHIVNTGNAIYSITVKVRIIWAKVFISQYRQILFLALVSVCKIMRNFCFTCPNRHFFQKDLRSNVMQNFEKLEESNFLNFIHIDLFSKIYSIIFFAILNFSLSLY